MPDLPAIVVPYETVKNACVDALNTQGYTSTRAGYLDKIPVVDERTASMDFFRAPIEGSVVFSTADTYPKTVTIIDTSGLSDVVGKLHYVEGYVDLSPLGSNEKITAEYKMVIKEGGSPVTYASEDFTGPVYPPLLYIHTRSGKYGVRVDLTMPEAPAADRVIYYQLFIRRSDKP